MNKLLNSLLKNLRYSVGFITLLAISVSSVYAQGNHTGQGMGKASPEDRAKKQTEMMKENLTLTSAQEPKVSDINLKYAKKMEDVRKMTDTAARSKAVKSLESQKEGELKKVLTADQFKAYLKMMEEFKARRRGMSH